FCFFFQAEDGIRDLIVTGVQTCALPIYSVGSYAMCYALSVGPDPFGPYYRYEFTRPLFPDYPRPAVWPDGHYVPTSTGDDVIQRSEERRVGKECRSRGWRSTEKNKQGCT